MTAAKKGTPLISLEVIAGPLDGLRHEGKQSVIQIGRSDGTGSDKKRNDLVLQRDSYASSFHAKVSHADGQWNLKDLNSTNGTWAAARKLAKGEQTTLVAGEVFVVGNTAIRLGTKSSRLPPVDPTASAGLSPATQTMLNRARNIAREQRSPWIGASHVFRVIAGSDAPPLPEFFQSVHLDPTAAADIVTEFDYWQGELEWIGNNVLRGRRTPEHMLKNVLSTPRLQLILTLADLVRERASAPHVEPIHLLAGMFLEPGNIVVLALSAAGYSADQLAAAAKKIIQGEEEPEEEEDRAPEREATVQVQLPMPAAVKQREAVDPETWLLARQMMDRLQSVQNEYHMAEPEARFEAICKAAREGLQKAPPAKRLAIVDELHYLFPVLEEALAPPPSIFAEAPKEAPVGPAETTDSHPEPDNMPDMAAASDELETGVDTDYLLNQIFGSEKIAQSISEMDEKNSFLRLMQHLYTFALEMEQLAKGLVQSVQGGAGGESRYFLPFTAHDLRMMVQKILEDKDERETVGNIRLYLYDLSNWIVALVAAHQKATSQWYGELWKRISPLAIQDEAKISSLNKALGQSKAELWKTYEQVAVDLKPEIVEDEFNERIGKLVTEEFRRMSSRG